MTVHVHDCVFLFLTNSDSLVFLHVHISLTGVGVD